MAPMTWVVSGSLLETKMPKGNKLMSDVPKGVQQPDNRPTNSKTTPMWENRRMAKLSKAAFDKKQRKLGVEPV